MRIAVEGCAHGELDAIYDSIMEVEKNTGKKIDLLICCGDFQATRNTYDLECMAVPDKYKQIRTFYKYYSGEKSAPVLTIFIGGNHEASNYLQELPYGGWVAPNIYYMGYASVVTFGGLRIAGISGIYKSQHLYYGHYELPPYNSSTIRSVYHIRNIEVFRLKQLTGQVDIFLSHDWPCGITKYGNERQLIKRKPYFKIDIENNQLGSPPCMELLQHHHPSYWFSAHLHCKFAALVPNETKNTATKFLALDKCLPKRKFLQILDIPHNENEPLKLSYDLEWLSILYLTNHLLNVQKREHYMPSSSTPKYSATHNDKQNILNKFNNDLTIPNNFEKTAEPFTLDESVNQETSHIYVNNQTTDFCRKLGIDDPTSLVKMIQNNKKDKEDEESFHSSSRTNLSTPGSNMDYSRYESVFDNSYTDTSINDSLLNDNDSENSSPSPKNILTDVDSSKEVSEIIPAEPTTKKLKRRNYSIYEDICK